MPLSKGYMATIGDRLEEARKRQGISLRDAAEATKIRTDFLQSFEDNRFDFDLPEVYKKGFLKLYAKFLKLDVEKIVTDYNALMLSQQKSTRREQRDTLGQFTLAESHPTLGSTEAEPPGDRKNRSGSAAPADPLRGMKEDPAMAFRLGAIAAIFVLVVVVIIGVVQLIFKGRSPENNAPEIESTTQTVPTQGQLTIRVSADTRLVYIKQVSDGANLYYGPMSAGQSETFTFTGEIRVGSSHKEHTSVTINGRSYTLEGTGPGQGAFNTAGPVR